MLKGLSTAEIILIVGLVILFAPKILPSLMRGLMGGINGLIGGLFGSGDKESEDE